MSGDTSCGNPKGQASIGKDHRTQSQKIEALERALKKLSKRVQALEKGGGE